jgi:hypothetical protein
MVEDDAGPAQGGRWAAARCDDRILRAAECTKCEKEGGRGERDYGGQESGADERLLHRSSVRVDATERRSRADATASMKSLDLAEFGVFTDGFG